MQNIPMFRLEEESTYFIHIVKSGENLWSLSQRFNTTVEDIKILNNLTSDFIRVGQQLLIPITEEKEIPKNTFIYTVVPKDTLFAIARRFCTTVDELKEVNNLTDDLILLNQQLFVPNIDCTPNIEQPNGCKCPCISKGELVENGEMEIFTGNIPNGWNATGRVERDTAQGRVHSGGSAVSLYNNSNLTQIIPISGDCFYELAFFGHGEGAQVGLTATVTFITPEDRKLGLQIAVRPQDIPNSAREFGFYRGITIKAPKNATAAEINFAVTASGNQHLDLDDVSFSVR